VPHTPLLWRELQAQHLADLAPVSAHFADFRARIEALRPDAVVMVASDHFRATSTAAMPAFMIGKTAVTPATFSNEVRAFDIPQFQVQGDPKLARALLGGRSLTTEFDFGYSDEIRLDHAFAIPLLYLRPDHDLPVVPIFTNATAPPMPVAQRFIELGTYLNRAIDNAGDGRVVIVVSAHLAFEIGGPRQFSGLSPDPEFDREAVRWLVERDLEGAAAGATFDRMLQAGNVTHQYLNLLVACAAAEGLMLQVGEGTACRHGNEPFFAWSSA